MGPRVYVVDDDPLVTDSLGTALRLETDWVVVAENDARAALAAMPAAPPDVVLSDLKMPGLDGIAFLKRVREGWPDAVLILLTGYADKESAIAAINEVGIWQYIEKPWDTTDLLLKVGQGLERRDLVRRLAERTEELSRRLAELEAAHERLVQSERLAAVGRVASGLAHELGNQLALVGFAEAILARAPDGEIADHARMILGAQRRLVAMVEEIQDFTRAPAGGYRLEAGDLAGVVDEALALLRFDRDVKARGVKTIADVRARSIARFHRGKLMQVVINLVRNAAQASPPGSEVRVVLEEDGGAPVLRVIDRGAGMDEATLARVGEPFFSTKEGGSGLGLGISRRIAAEHGGTLAIRSRVGEGTEVEVRLPSLDAASNLEAPR
jgi:signal transduction histidine kinase